MNSRAMTLSVLMAGIAVFFVMNAVTSIEESSKQKFGDEVTVLVAKTDIREMDTVLDSMVEPKAVPKRFVEPSALAFNTLVQEGSPDYAIEVKQILGQVAVVPIKKGEQLARNKLSEPSLRTGLSPQITPGRRGVTIPVDETTSVAKLIKPGDRVDLITVLDVGGGVGGRENRVAKTFIQDVVVLAVGRNVTNNLARKVEIDSATGKARTRSLNEFDGFNSVTVEVDPSQAQQLAAVLATSSSKIFFSLRNNDDTDRAPLNISRATDVVSELRSPASTQSNGSQPEANKK